MYRIGVDLGGTNIKIGIADSKYRLAGQLTCRTNVKLGADSVIQEIASQVHTLLSRSNIPKEEIAGVGIGCPGVVRGETGTVLYSNNFDWEDIPLKERLQRLLPWQVSVRNDAQCAALGELLVGGAVGCRNVVLLTLGTGVGSGIVVDGRLLEGSGGGGVAGHMAVKQGGRECTCGRRGCLEAYASATALIRETRKQLELHPESVISELCGGDPENIDGKAAFQAARRGDPWGQKIVDEYTEALAGGIANLIDLFRPEKVLISGGVCNEGDPLLIPLNQKVKENCFAAAWLPVPPVEIASLKNTAGMIGAASLAGK